MFDEEKTWRTKSACRDVDPERLFVRGADQNSAKSVCFQCPVRTECLAEALDRRIQYGIWGGATERERRRILKQNKEVASWWDVLIGARAEYFSELVG